MSGPNMPTQVMMFREFIPNRIRVFLCLFLATAFQFSGGIYLSSVSQMVGSLALMQEDIMMAGYASFVGMTVVFPILFRLKFRFTSRSILLFVCPALIVCNLITMHTDSLPVLVTVCFIAGMLRMWGTFEALSNTQLSLTPTRDFAVFFPVVYMIVLGSIQLSGLLTVYLGYWANWRFMHLIIIGLLLVVWLIVVLFTRHFRFMRPLPLFGIDWIGVLLWSIFLLSFIFVLEYGQFYDWFDSPYICMASVIAILAVLLNIHRIMFRRHPFIEKEAFRYRNLFALLVLFLMLCLLQATPNVLQNMFTGGILKYDVLNAVSLNWWNFAGTVLGAVLTFLWHAKLHGNFKVPVFWGFTCLVAYQCFMYFLIDPRMNIEQLYFPTFLRGWGYITLYISLTVYVTGIVPFQHFFQVLAILGFIRTGFGSVLGTAIYGRAMQALIPENIQNLSTHLDAVNTALNPSSMGGIFSAVSTQAMLVSLKEVYGWVCIVGIVLLIVILCGTHLNRYMSGRLPRIRRIKQIIKRNIPLIKAEQ